MASDAGGGGFLVQAAIYLGAASVAVPLFNRLKLGSILGYLAAGLLIGPSVLGLVKNVSVIQHLAEFGVVFLLFLIGLELSFRRLAAMRTEVFGLGTAQVLVTALLATLVLVAVGLWVLVILARPFTPWKTVLVGAMVGAVALILVVEPFRDFYALELPEWRIIGQAALIAVGATLVLEIGWRASRLIGRSRAAE